MSTSSIPLPAPRRIYSTSDEVSVLIIESVLIISIVRNNFLFEDWLFITFFAISINAHFLISRNVF